jgi:fumarylacetoacetate (FAA) hydrolase
MAAVESGNTALAAEDVELTSPVPNPPSVRDAYAFRQHVATARRNRGLEMIPEFDEIPIFYFTNHQAVFGEGYFPVLSRHTEKLDFELECAAVIGKGGRNISVTDADDYIAGFMIMNDLSARVLQMQEMKLNLGPAKGKDFGSTFGPWLVTKDELEPYKQTYPDGDRYDLKMKAFVNDIQVSGDTLSNMTWTFAQIIERVSYGVDIFPGDIIGSGTCGTGCFLELNGSKITDNQWLNPGDTVSLEIEELGTLTNKIVLENV